MQEKPFSAACENNKEPILRVLESVFNRAKTVLEIGSGTGQHAVYFSAHLPHLTWQPSDRAENLPGINLWLADAQQGNINPPLILDVRDGAWPEAAYDGVFSANTAHIMAWETVLLMLAGAANRLVEGGAFCLYGPFNYDGEFTSESNARFHQSLIMRDPAMGIRDCESVVSAAQACGLQLQSDNDMPANNRLLVLKKV